MGRRSTHTPQQLRELILDAAQEIIQVQGLAGLSAREIARRIEYSPGTIYNMFENLDDVVLHVEARVLEALDKRLSTLLQDGNPAGKVSRRHTPCSVAAFGAGPGGRLPGLGTLRCDPAGVSAALVENMRITAVTGFGEISNSISCRIL